MQNKKTFLIAFSVSIFLGGFLFLFPTNVSANYPATLTHYCTGSGILQPDNTCQNFVSANATWTGSSWTCPSSYTLIYDDADYSYWCSAKSGAPYASSTKYVCNGSDFLSGTTCITDNGCAANTCSNTTCWNGYKNVTGIKGCGVSCNTSSAPNRTGQCSSADSFTVPDKGNLWYSWATGADYEDSEYICSNGSWVQGYRDGGPNTITSKMDDWSSNTGYGKHVECITDNGCAANTCNNTTCWNNTAWVTGTKVCADNSCAANTCTTATCWNNLTWIAGTKNCDNGCAANTCNNTTCWNNISWVTGTKVCADNSCAANICTNQTCWNNLAWISGTKPPTFNYLGCTYSDSVDCSKIENCAKIDTKTPSACLGVNSCTGATDNRPLSECSGICSTSTIDCPPCPLETTSWKEVAPN